MGRELLAVTRYRLTEGVRILAEAAEQPELSAAEAEAAAQLAATDPEAASSAGGSVTLVLPKQGGGILLPECIRTEKRYLTFFQTVEENHSTAFQWNFYVEGETEPAFLVRFGILGGVRSKICLDLNWTDAGVLFPGSTVGQQKVVCHGRRITGDETVRVELVGLPCFHEVKIRLEDLTLTDEFPDSFPIPDGKRVDCLGQNKCKEWPGKTKDEAELKERLQEEYRQSEEGYPFSDWSKYGGWKEKRLASPTGFFTRCKQDGRWWLVDPDGYAFFSMGPDCVNSDVDCRVDGLEKWMDWLPPVDDPEYRDCWTVHEEWPPKEMNQRECRLFSFSQANLHRAFGENWHACWQRMAAGQLRRLGMNTLGNWSDLALFGTCGVPYVTSLPEFPETEQKIFRDFPDVFAAEYAENAEKNAQALTARRNDPWMIGYFLRNEPSWAFVDNLVLADEVLYNPARTACREALITFVKEKYGTVQSLNAAWGTAFDSFDDLYGKQERMSERFPGARADLKEFSRRMLRAYVEIPAKACRRADPNHMILGMRWAWISDPDLVCGWENFDVFSINCYAQDPTAAIDNIVKLGVDLPVMIGEFHFGALDAGPDATGLEGVRTQKERGVAYRHYCEMAAAHPYGVGCHWFQCYDQFTLGRFDGENYNIGLFDICFAPYPEMTESVRACSREIYPVAAGEQEPFAETAESIPMIAY